MVRFDCRNECRCTDEDVIVQGKFKSNGTDLIGQATCDICNGYICGDRIYNAMAHLLQEIYKWKKTPMV
jgi:hypothetical protein